MNHYYKIIYILAFFLVFQDVWSRDEDEVVHRMNRAIAWNNSHAIRKIIRQHPEYLNYTDSDRYNTPLVRAVAYCHYAAAKQLLDLGADPNIRTKSGYLPLVAAIEGHPKRIAVSRDTRFLRLLSQYGANLNDTCSSHLGILLHRMPAELNDTCSGRQRIIWKRVPQPAENILCISVSPFFMEQTKCLVELGADINQAGIDGKSVVIEALRLDNWELAHYLIVEKKADVTCPFYYFRQDFPEIDYTKKHYLVEYLLDMVFPLDSEDYKMKMELVEEFKRQGVDYQSWKDRITPRTMKRIKKRYGDDWEAYVEKY